MKNKKNRIEIHLVILPVFDNNYHLIMKKTFKYYHKTNWLGFVKKWYEKVEVKILRASEIINAHYRLHRYYIEKDKDFSNDIEKEVIIKDVELVSERCWYNFPLDDIYKLTDFNFFTETIAQEVYSKLYETNLMNLETYETVAKFSIKPNEE